MTLEVMGVAVLCTYETVITGMTHLAKAEVSRVWGGGNAGLQGHSVLDSNYRKASTGPL